MCANTENHDALIQEDVLTPLASALDVDDLETRFNACFATNKLSMNENIITMIGEHDCEIIPPLVRLVGDPDVPSRTQAISTLRRLSLDQMNRQQIIVSGAMDLLADACGEENLETQREIAACICSLALSAENKVLIAKSKMLEPVLSLGQSPDVEVSR